MGVDADRSLMDRFDRWVERAGQRMANKPSRRRFLGGVGAGIAALGVTNLLTPSTAQAACVLPAGCFGTESVNVCYSPWRVTATEPGQSNGVVVRKGPSFSAAPVTRHDTGGPVVISVGGHFARCSNRTGSVSQGCPDPGPRPQQGPTGWIWGYWVGYHRQGWMPFSVGGVTYAVGDNTYANDLCGPDGADFDCRLGTEHPKSDCTDYTGCGGATVGDPTCSETYRPIVSYPTDPSDQRFYLRYGANSTTFFWLVPGDRLKRWGYKSGGTYNWSCVQVICAAYAPNGCRGWVRSDALGSPITDNSPCYPSVSCPSGSSG